MHLVGFYYKNISRFTVLWISTLPHSCADCLEIWEPLPPQTLRACPGL